MVFEIMQCYKYLLGMSCSTKQSHLCSIMFEQPLELLLVKIKLMSKMLLHCISLNSNMH